MPVLFLLDIINEKGVFLGMKKGKNILIILLIISLFVNLTMIYKSLSLNMFLKEQYYYYTLSGTNAINCEFLNNTNAMDTKFHLGSAWALGTVLDRSTIGSKPSIEDVPSYSLIIQELMYYIFDESVKENREQIIDIYLKSIKQFNNKNLKQIYNDIHNQLLNL